MTDKPELKLPPERYQPNKREVLEDVAIDTTPDELVEAVLRPIKLMHSRQLKHRKSN